MKEEDYKKKIKTLKDNPKTGLTVLIAKLEEAGKLVTQKEQELAEYL